MVVCNKVDVMALNDLSPEKKDVLKVFEENAVPLMSMSTLTEQGVAEVKQQVKFFNMETFLINYLYN